MDITLHPEDQQRAQRLVDSGRFATVEDAVHAGLEALQEDDQWLAYARSRIEAGVAALEKGNFATEAEVDALFAKYQLKSA